MNSQFEIDNELQNRIFEYRDILENELKTKIENLLKNFEKYDKELLDYLDISITIDNYRENFVDFNVEIVIPLEKGIRIWFEGIENECAEYVDRLAEEKEITEDNVESEFDKCFEEKIKEFDSQYCNSITLEYDNGIVHIYVKPICVEEAYYKNYYNAIIIEHKRSIAYALFRDNDYRDIALKSAENIYNSIEFVLNSFLSIYYYKP